MHPCPTFGRYPMVLLLSLPLLSAADTLKWVPVTVIPDTGSALVAARHFVSCMLFRSKVPGTTIYWYSTMLRDMQYYSTSV